jgi:hypothetical protein
MQQDLIVASAADQPSTPALHASREGDLLAMVLEKGNIEVLERYIALRKEEEERQAALEFSRHFSEMQKEFVEVHVGRWKKGYDYHYAPIESLQTNYGPLIAKHGFFYRWSERSLEGGKKVVTLTISGWGHAEENSFEVPLVEGTKQQNPIQVQGAMSTYGRRYTFISGFGIVIEDEDSDGRPDAEPANTEALASATLTIQNSRTLDELVANWMQIYKGFKDDKAALGKLVKVKQAREKELPSGTAK